MAPVSVSPSSPLKVRERKGRIWAEDAGGQVVLDGRTREHWPQRYVAETVTGTHRIAARVEAGPLRYFPIVETSGREIGRVVTERRKEWELQLVTGDSIRVSKRGGMLTPLTCTIGELSTAVAPRLAPQRYFTLTLSESVFGRPDRDALIVALAWISESTIASLIGEGGSGAD